jgi:hypothetical protein
MEASTASLIAIIQVEPGLLIRVLRHGGLATISPLARTCTLTAQIITERWNDVLAAIAHSPQSEMELIRHLLHRNLSPLMFKYPHIRAELERTVGRADPPYTCITFWPDRTSPVFYCYTDPQRDTVNHVRVVIDPGETFAREWSRINQHQHYAISLNGVSTDEYIIFGRCACSGCEPWPALH